MTELGMATDYWTHYYANKPQSQWECETDDFEQLVAEMEASEDMPEDDDFEDISHGRRD